MPAGLPLSSLAAALLLAVPALAQTPSLAELAKKEEARRKAVQAPVKLLTNDDVKRGTPPPVQPAPADPGGKPTPSAAESVDTAKDKSASRSDDPQKDEAYWRALMTLARESLRRDEMFAEALQTRINALSADFTARDDPQQRARIAEDRVKALAELDRLKQDIETQKKKIADLEEEARRAGVPPGWLR